MDIRAAFLQARWLDRDVYLLPPKDIRKGGYVWKLKKPLYGLNNVICCGLKGPFGVLWRALDPLVPGPLEEL